jgi:hypothetical protein
LLAEALAHMNDVASHWPVLPQPAGASAGQAEAQQMLPPPVDATHAPLPQSVLTEQALPAVFKHWPFEHA